MWKPTALFLALTAAACATTGDHAGHDADHDQAAAEVTASAEVAAYPLTVCTVSGEALPDEGYATATIGDREMRFCCPSCAAAAEGDPARATAEFETALKDSQRDAYPLNTCLVAGTELGAMGEPHELLVGDTLVRLCCAGCAAAVEADPDRYLAQLALAQAE